MDNRTIYDNSINGNKIFTAIFDRYEPSNDGRVYIRLINIKNAEGKTVLDSFLVDANTQGLAGSIILGTEIAFSALKVECEESVKGFSLADFCYISKKN